jgi:large subunit ribosomal protein L22
MNYAFKDYNKENMARAVGVALPISYKHSFEVCNFIRNRPLARAKKLLLDVAEKKAAVPYRRFDFDLAHKRKIGPGRYPVKTVTEILTILESAEKNAQFKGLNTSNLVIVHISSHNAGKSFRYGRQSRRKAKRTHVEIVLQEKSQSKPAKESKEKKESKETKEAKKE